MWRISLLSFLFLLHIGSTSGGRKMKHLMEGDRIAKMTIGRSVMDYVGYGNYCGYGGAGPVLDPIDDCCRTHDNCYNMIQSEMGPFCEPLGAPFRYGVNMETLELTCTTEPDYCRKKVCWCDKNFAGCLQENDMYYNAQLKNPRRMLRSVGEFFTGLI